MQNQNYENLPLEWHDIPTNRFSKKSIFHKSTMPSGLERLTPTQILSTILIVLGIMFVLGFAIITILKELCL